MILIIDIITLVSFGFINRYRPAVQAQHHFAPVPHGSLHCNHCSSGNQFVSCLSHAVGVCRTSNRHLLPSSLPSHSRTIVVRAGRFRPLRPRFILTFLGDCRGQCPLRSFHILNVSCPKLAIPRLAHPTLKLHVCFVFKAGQSPPRSLHG